MFQPTPGMLDAWRAAGKPPATPADVQTLERGLGIVLPPAYVDFIRQFGFVSFGNDTERRWRFDCPSIAVTRKVGRWWCGPGTSPSCHGPTRW